jgi:hypothetical protein
MNLRGEDDDFTLEVSDLRTGRLLASPLSRQPPSSDASAADETMLSDADADDDALTITSLDSNAPIVPRRPTLIFASRRSRSLAVIGLSLLICAGILLSLPDTRQGLAQVFQGPTPTPSATIEPGGNTFYLVNGVPWGTLTADGKPVNVNGNVTGDFPSFTLARGRHQVQYVAAPFPTLRCQVSVPRDTHDTCPFTTNYQFDNMGDARVVDLGLTPDKLPADQLAALVRVVAIGLEQDVSSAAVQPGDHYLGANGKPAVATTALRATLSLTLNIDPSRSLTSVPGPSVGGSCVTLCAAGFFSGPNGWDFFAHVVVQWRFAARAGSPTPMSSPETDTSFELSASWLDIAWSLDPLTSGSNQFGNLCNDAFFAVANNGSLVPFYTGGYETIASAPNAADGCADVISSSNDVNPPPSGLGATPTPLPADAALFIYRFGLVLAGNPLAHKAQPQLPLATAHEQALALEWLPNP